MCRIWLQAARPATLPAAIAPVVLGNALAFATHVYTWWVAVLTLLGALLIQIGTNFFNDYADFKHGADTAHRLGPVRVTQRGLVPPKHVLWATYAAFTCATLCGAGLVWQAGWVVVWVGTASILAGLLYTGGPYPLGYHGLGDICVFIFFGLVAVCCTFFIHTHTLSPLCIVAAIAMGTLATAILVVNNLRDRVTDAVANKRTLAVRFGATLTRCQYTLLLVVAYSMLLFADNVLPWLTCPYAVYCIRYIWQHDGAALNVLLGRTALLEGLFALLFAAQVLLWG